MNKKLLKVNSWILKIVGSTLIIISTIFLISTLSVPSEPNSWDDLGKFVAGVATVIAYIIGIPFIIAGIKSSKSQKEKKKEKIEKRKKTSKIFSIISIILSMLFIFTFILKDVLDYYEDYSTGHVNVGLKVIHILLIFVIFVLPQLINLIGLSGKKITLKSIWNDKKGKCILISTFIIISIFGLNLIVKQIIISTNKMQITEDKLYSYWDFRKELESRNLYGQKGAPRNEISAMDSSSKYAQEFSEINNPANAMIFVGEDRKFPFYIYDTYTTLIEKRDKNTPHDYIDYDDIYVDWIIYYVDGKIYAALDQESEYGNTLARTEYGVIVSEEEDITIYNTKNNYLVKGGCITDTSSGMQRSGFPTTKDIYNKDCIRIKKVERIDSKTLDSLAKVIVPEYYKNKSSK